MGIRVLEHYVGSEQHWVRRLLKVSWTTYAAEAGIRISGKPIPLIQLLMLCMFASKPIDATVAVRATQALFEAGLRCTQTVLASGQPTMISAFDRVHYSTLRRKLVHPT